MTYFFQDLRASVVANILIIDDDKMICDSLSKVVKRSGHNVSSALTLNEGLKEALSTSFDVVFLDVNMPDGNGLDVLPRIRETSSSPEVIIITGSGDPNGAELAIKSGAWDYIEKPLSIKDVTLPLVRSLQYREEKKTRKPLVSLKKEGILGNSSQMKTCFDLLAKAADSDVNVLVTGETGTGKELFARASHQNSSRSNKNFVVVDCAALPDTLIESVLFGHTKGAFTGADRVQIGLIEQADRGTLFLDEVGELPLSLQKAFLRVLQEHHFRPIGSEREIKSDFRLISSTNRNLDEMVQGGRFRKDLLFRLHSFNIELPPLREHAEDIKELVIYYIAKLCEHYGIGTKGFSPELMDALVAYDWPGNVRELVNTLERAIATARNEPTLFHKHLPIHIRVKLARAMVSKEVRNNDRSKGNTISAEGFPKLKDFRETTFAKAEQQYLQDLMWLTKGNMKEACQLSGVSRSRLYELIKKYKNIQL